VAQKSTKIPPNFALLIAFLPIFSFLMRGYKRGQKHVRNLRLYQVDKRGKPYWRLRTPDPSGTGFSERQFSSEAEAQTAFDLAYAQNMNHGLKAGSLGAKERGDAIAALDILRPFSVSLADAANYYRIHHTNIREKLVKDAVRELLAAKKQDGLSVRYQKDLRNRLERFESSFGTRKIAEVSVDEIEDWLRNLSLGPLSRNTFWLRLSVLFEFARRRHWCAENPLALVQKAKWKGALPGILTPEQFARLLETAGAETLPYWAIGGWCGLRSAELERLEWQDIDFEACLVEVTRAKSKTASRRHVQIRPALAAWIAPLRGQTGKVCPVNLRIRLERDRERAGIMDWPANALRHSFASYHLEHFKEPGTLTVEMGHTTPALVQRFYRQRVRPEAAKKWWSILPPAHLLSHEHSIVEGQFRLAS
jgi:integrase